MYTNSKPGELVPIVVTAHRMLAHEDAALIAGRWSRQHYVSRNGDVFRRINTLIWRNFSAAVCEEVPVFVDHGYARVKLSLEGGGRKWLQVHSLVLETFGDLRPSEKYHCAHLDGDRKNNHIDNLAWKLGAENEADKKRHGSRIGSKPGHRKLTLKRKLAILDDYARSGMGVDSFTQIGKRHHVHRSTVARLVGHKCTPTFPGGCELCEAIDKYGGGM